MKKSLPTITNTCRLGRGGVTTPLHYLTRKEKTMTNEELLETILWDLDFLSPVWIGVNDDDEDTAFKISMLKKKYKEWLSNVE